MASRSINKVILVGHLGKDAETKYTGAGTAMTRFSVATARRWKDQATNEWKEEADWHNILLWKMEGLGQYLTKGKQVYIEGRLQTRSYEKDGEKRYSTEVIAEDVILLGGGGERGEGLVSQPRSAAPAQRQPMDAGISDDDIPW